MTWVRIDDGFAEHPKVVGLSDAAFRQHVVALCYAGRRDTDGDIPKAAPFIRKKLSKELVDAGLWDEIPTGFAIHDFLIYNPSAERTRSRRDSKAMAGAKGAASRWHGPTHDGGHAPVPDPSPTPSRPAPDPIAREAAADDDPTLTRCVQAYDAMMGRLATTPTTLGQIRDWLREQAGSSYDLAEWFESACGKAALQDKRSLGYVLGVLRRESAEGRGDNRPGKPSGDPERDEYMAARARGTDTGAGLRIYTMADEATIQRYEAKQREAV